MKFLKNLLAVILGVFVAMGLLSVLFLGIIGSLLPSEKPITVEPSTVLKISLTEPIAERTVKESFDIGSLLPIASAPVSTLGIYDAVRALDAAATDPNIKYIYISASGASSALSNLEEIRGALERCRNAGVPIVSYGVNFSMGEYYLASVADRIYADEFGMNDIRGISGNIIFLKDILDRVGVDVQLIRHGKYKSAGEQFVARDISEANREQNEAMMNAMWETVAGSICYSRGLSMKDLDRLVNGLEINTAEEMLAANLVDEVCTMSEIENTLASMAGKEKLEDVKMLTLSEYASAVVKPNFKAKQKIAVIYADGQINLSGDGITYQSLVPEIQKVRRDSTVKAVVLRVNSPGGAVQPAEIIRTELELLQEVKPLIVSYGSYAASGGYWISAGADKIYADNTTLTGSIGVFSLIPSGEKVAREKLHLNPVTIKTHKHADMYSMFRKMDAKEVETSQQQVEMIYDRFVTIVAEGRGMTKESVDRIAQGRVWCGNEALEIGLVNEIGGLKDAVEYAAVAAGTDDYRVVEYPAVKNTVTKLMENVNSANALAGMFSSAPEELAMKLFRQLLPEPGIYAMMPYTIVFDK